MGIIILIEKGKEFEINLSLHIILKAISLIHAYKRRLVDSPSFIFPLIGGIWGSTVRTGGSRLTKKMGAGTSGRAVAAAIRAAVSVVAATFPTLLR